MNTPDKDYSRTERFAVLALLGVLVAVSFIPPQSFGGIKLRRANILSDLVSFDDGAAPAEAPQLFDESDFQIDLGEVAERIVADTLPRDVQTRFEWTLPGAEHLERNLPTTGSEHPARAAVAIEDFSADSCIRAFCDTLLHARRPVRIAFLGDSFIEGDILTADLREQLQTAYGGGGAGFAPVASPLTAFRRTIETQSKGWTSYNIMQRRRAPEALRGKFYLSGWLCQPAANASTRWENTDARKRLDSCTTARVFFLATRDSRIELTLNDTLRKTFTITGDDALRQVTVTAPHIHSLALRIVEGDAGFVGYGAIFETPGVVVDNYSVRSNNGQAMFWTDPSINAQFDAFLGYDLVILQYGLNIMQQDVHAYGGYAAQIEKMVAFVRECFPRAAVLILGVSDRSVKTEAGFEPMNAIPHMLEYQRAAARNSGAAFWPTSEAMRAMGGMQQFVANGWAGKDYTHINYAGGRQIARALFAAIDDRARRLRDTQTKAARREQAVVDSLQRLQIERQLRTQAKPQPLNPPIR